METATAADRFDAHTAELRLRGGCETIGTDYTPGLLAALAETPRLRAMETPATPNGQRVASYTKRYTDEWECKTTLFDVGGAELVSTTADCGADGSRFGFALDHDVKKVAVSSRPGGLSVSFVVGRLFGEGLDERSVDLPASSSVEFGAEVDVVCAIEEEYTGSDTITSFFEDETSDEPWLVIVEPD